MKEIEIELTPLEYVLANTKEYAFLSAIKRMDIQSLYDYPKMRDAVMREMGFTTALQFSVYMAEAFSLYRVDKASIETIDKGMKKYSGLYRLAKREGRHADAEIHMLQHNSLLEIRKVYVKPLADLKRKYKSVQKSITCKT